MIPVGKAKVISCDYEIEEMSKKESVLSEATGVALRTDNPPKIKVLPSGEPSTDADTVLHELLHCAWHVMGCGETEPEERAVGAMATSVIAILRDNEELCVWLLNSLGYTVYKKKK